MTLDQLAIKHNCDKSSEYHDYCKIYERYLSECQHANCNVLELGYGGYDDPNSGGESAKMWREYFTTAELTVVDWHWKDNVPEGVKFIQCSQDDTILSELPKWDIIIDDASHINSLTIASFKLLWSRLHSGGLAFIIRLVLSRCKSEPERGRYGNELLETIDGRIECGCNRRL